MLQVVAEEARSQQISCLGGLECGDRVGAWEEEVFESEVRADRGIQRVQRLQNHLVEHRRRRRRFRFDGLLCGSLTVSPGADP